MMNNPFPNFIKHIRIIAPAGAVEQKKMDFNRALVESWGIKVSYSKHLFNDIDPLLNYCSAPLACRLDDFHEAYRDQSVDLILCARGGYGTPQLLPHIDWDCVRSRGHFPLLGYSDITALHLAMCQKKVGLPISALHLNFFAESISFPMVQSQLSHAILPKKDVSLSFKASFKQNQGEVTAPIYAVNLSMLETLIGTPYLPDLTHAILLIEEISEPIRKIDRAFTHLENAGILHQLGGMLLGYFTECESIQMQQAFFAQLAGKCSFPIGSGIPFGHERPSLPIANGQIASIHISNTQTQVTFHENSHAHTHI